MDEMPIKTVVWVGPARKALKEFPRPVQRAVGLALYAAQLGETPPDAKVLKGFGGAGVLELVEDENNGLMTGIRRDAGEQQHVPQGRYLSCGLHRPVRDEDLRAARVPEEIEARHRHAAEGNRVDPRPASMGRAP
jgi:hypothetical protein